MLRLDYSSRVVLSLVSATLFTVTSLATAAATTLTVTLSLTLSRVMSSVLSMSLNMALSMTVVLATTAATTTAATTMGLTFNVNLSTVLSIVLSVAMSTAITTTATTTTATSLTTSAAVSSINTAVMAVSVLKGSISDTATAQGLGTFRLAVASLVVALNLNHVITITASSALATSGMASLVLGLLLGRSTLAEVILASDRVNLSAGNKGTVLSGALALDLLDDGAEAGDAGAVVLLLLNEGEKLDAVTDRAHVVDTTVSDVLLLLGRVLEDELISDEQLLGVVKSDVLAADDDLRL